MIWIGKRMSHLLSNLTSFFGANVNHHSDQGAEMIFCSSDRYQPSIKDVLTVKEALHKKSALPYEVVDVIVDMAEYWPHTTTISSRPMFIRGGSNGGSHAENQFILRSYPVGYLPPENIDPHQDFDFCLFDEEYQTMMPTPWFQSSHQAGDSTEEILSQWSSRSIPRGRNPCRKIVFTIKSHDQGWVTNPDHRGTYVGSFTWFEAGLERMTASRNALIVQNVDTAQSFRENGQEKSRSSAASSLGPLICNLQTIIPSLAERRFESTPDAFKHELLPSKTLTIQKNVVASKKATEHKVIWRSSDDVVPESPDEALLEGQGQGEESANGEYVRGLGLGDVVTVWGKARFRGWENHVEQVKVDLYWAV